MVSSAAQRELLTKLDFNQIFTNQAEIIDDVDTSPFSLNNCESKYYDTFNFSNSVVPSICNSHEIFLHLNIQGLPPKYDELKTFLYNISNQPEPNLPSVIGLSETFLNGFNYTNYELFGYQPPISNYRKDNSSRGGVSLFVREGTDFIERPDLNTFVPMTFESVFITLKPSNVTVGVIYRTPDSNYREFLLYFQRTLLLLNQSKHPFFLLGDFNFDLLTYNRESSVSEFVDTIFENGCLPVITKPTRVTPTSASCLDNIITNKIFPNSFSGIFIEDISDHFPVFYCYPSETPRIKNDQTNKPTVPHYNLSKDNIKALQDKLKMQDWNEILAEDDPSIAAVLLTNVISDFLDQTCLSRTKSATKILSRRNQPWFTPGLKISLKRKKSLYKKSLKNRDLVLIYRNYRNIYNKVVRQAKRNYYSNELSKAQNNMKKTWSILKEVVFKTKTKETGINKLNLSQPDSFTTSLNDPALIAEYFNNYFSSVGSRISSSLPIENFDPIDLMNDNCINDSLFFLPTDKKEIIETTLSVKSKVSTGHDNLSNKLIKEIVAHISIPLTHIFNKSLSLGAVPDIYKIAKVIPVFKTGDKNDPNNYRPISLLPAFSKILEKIVYKRVINFLLKYNVIYPQQYGFLNGRSTEQAMIDLVLSITKAIEDKQATIGIFLDLSKAFDSISHEILLRKLSRYGIRGTPLKWFSSYLTNRFQFVKKYAATSSLQLLTSGIPQGSVLGPLLFLLYINDMPAISTTLRYILFADDTTGTYSSSSIDDLFDTANREITFLSNWFAANKLMINTSKTNYVLFMSHQKEKHIPSFSDCELSMNSCQINQKDSVKFLGIKLDKNLNFKDHIDSTSVKLTKSLYALSQASKVLPIKDMKTLYCSLFLPHLNYGLLTWGGLCKLDNKYSILDHGISNNPMRYLSKLHLLQKRAIRIIAKSNYIAHHIPLCSELDILDLPDLYNVKALSLFHEFYHNNLPPALSNIFDLSYSRDGHLKVKTRFHRTNIAASSIVHTLPDIWNNLPNPIKVKIAFSKKTFLSQVKTFYISKYKTWFCETLDCRSCLRSST